MLRLRTPVLLICLLFPAMSQAGQILVDLGRGPVTVHVPAGYDSARPTPLIVLLHGYTGTGAGQESYLQLLPLSEQYGFLYAYPDGTTDSFGSQFWNGTDACCDLFGTGIDDSAYLFNLVRTIRNQLNVDPWRIHFAGHSNGGFMSYRMACDHADVVASIASLAGATFFDPAGCTPAGPVHTLQIHGTNDGTILYGGGNINGTLYPGALQTAETWAGYDGCALTPDASAPPRDLDDGIAGNESTVQRWVDGCTPAGSAALWTIQGGSHAPAVSDDFRSGVVEFLLSHSKAGLVFTDPATLTWPALRWAASYRVYRGDLAALFDTDADGLPDSGYGDCISASDPDPTDTVLSTPSAPQPGQGFFYAVGFVDGQGNASVLGTTGAGLPREPTFACP